MLLATYYALNYAGKIGQGLTMAAYLNRKYQLRYNLAVKKYTSR